MTTIKTITAAAASLAAGATLMSVAGPAAQANPYNSFGDAGGCDSVAIGGRGPNGGGFLASRDCEDHRNWASREARRNRQHDTQSQLIGLGGGLLGQIINGSQQRQQAASVSSSELALLRQQQEIELLKMQLQMQQQPGYGYQTVNYAPAPQAPVYHQPAYGYQQQSSYQQHSGYVQQPRYVY